MKSATISRILILKPEWIIKEVKQKIFTMMPMFSGYQRGHSVIECTRSLKIRLLSQCKMATVCGNPFCNACHWGSSAAGGNEMLKSEENWTGFHSRKTADGGVCQNLIKAEFNSASPCCKGRWLREQSEGKKSYRILNQLLRFWLRRLHFP